MLCACALVQTTHFQTIALFSVAPRGLVNASPVSLMGSQLEAGLLSSNWKSWGLDVCSSIEKMVAWFIARVS